MDNGCQFVAVNVFGGEATAKHIVTRCHNLQAIALHIGVDYAGGDKKCLACAQRQSVHETSDHDPGVAWKMAHHPVPQIPEVKPLAG